MVEDSIILQLKKVVAGYGKPVVGPVSFDVHKGEILGLGGYNGAGKTTILRVITGMCRLFAGTVRRTSSLTISHLWQRPEFLPELAVTGRELFALLGADPEDAPETIRPYINQPLYRLSGGQFQLLQALACIYSSADLVLMDEPTNNLDGRALEQLSRILQDMGPDRAVLLVSHEKSFLKDNCSRMVELQDE